MVEEEEEKEEEEEVEELIDTSENDTATNEGTFRSRVERVISSEFFRGASHESVEELVTEAISEESIEEVIKIEQLGVEQGAVCELRIAAEQLNACSPSTLLI
jgi:hypothetical protein